MGFREGLNMCKDRNCRSCNDCSMNAALLENVGLFVGRYAVCGAPRVSWQIHGTLPALRNGVSYWMVFLHVYECASRARRAIHSSLPLLFSLVSLPTRVVPKERANRATKL